MSALNPDTAELLLVFVSCQLDWHLMYKECLCFLTLSPRALQSEVVLRFCCRTGAALLSSNLLSTQICHKLWNLSFSVPKSVAPFRDVDDYDRHSSWTLFCQNRCRFFCLSCVTVHRPSRMTSQLAQNFLQDLVLKLTGVTTRLAIMENGDGGGNGRAGWRRAARPAAPTLSAPVQSATSSAVSHRNYHFTWLEPCRRDASGCARIL